MNPAVKIEFGFFFEDLSILVLPTRQRKYYMQLSYAFILKFLTKLLVQKPNENALPTL